MKIPKFSNLLIQSCFFTADGRFADVFVHSVPLIIFWKNEGK